MNLPSKRYYRLTEEEQTYELGHAGLGSFLQQHVNDKGKNHMTFGTVIAFNLKWSETLDNMKGCGAMVFTCSPLLSHLGYCFMGIKFFFHISW